MPDSAEWNDRCKMNATNKSGFWKSIFINVLSAAIIGTGGYAFGALNTKKNFEQRYESGPKIYIDALGKQIDQASSLARSLPDTPNQEQFDSIVTAAKTIVSTRDDLRDSLTSVSKLLNSDIDHLKAELNRTGLGDGLSAVRPNELKTIIIVLEGKWPTKKLQLEVELRKLIAELGAERE